MESLGGLEETFSVRTPTWELVGQQANQAQGLRPVIITKNNSCIKQQLETLLFLLLVASKNWGPYTAELDY